MDSLRWIQTHNWFERAMHGANWLLLGENDLILHTVYQKDGQWRCFGDDSDVMYATAEGCKAAVMKRVTAGHR